MDSARKSCKNMPDVLCYIPGEYSVVPNRNPVTSFIHRTLGNTLRTCYECWTMSLKLFATPLGAEHGEETSFTYTVHSSFWGHQCSGGFQSVRCPEHQVWQFHDDLTGTKTIFRALAFCRSQFPVYQNSLNTSLITDLITLLKHPSRQSERVPCVSTGCWNVMR